MSVHTVTTGVNQRFSVKRQRCFTTMNTSESEPQSMMTSLFKSLDVFQQLMFQTDSTRSVPHLWLSLRDLRRSIYTLLCEITSILKQESCAIAKMTARCVL